MKLLLVLAFTLVFVGYSSVIFSDTQRMNEIILAEEKRLQNPYSAAAYATGLMSVCGSTAEKAQEAFAKIIWVNGCKGRQGKERKEDVELRGMELIWNHMSARKYSESNTPTSVICNASNAIVATITTEC